MTRIKVCGVTRVADAIACADAGVDAIGINCWAGSSRYCDVDLGRSIADAVRDRVKVVAVFVDEQPERIAEVVGAIGADLAQLHGNEQPEALDALTSVGVTAFKAIRVADPASIDEARRYGDCVLLDASVAGLVGGTGRTFDWTLAAELCRERRVVLAGGIGPANVREAIDRVRPFAVDVASGVEHAPGRKDIALVRALVASVRSTG